MEPDGELWDANGTDSVPNLSNRETDHSFQPVFYHCPDPSATKNSPFLAKTELKEPLLTHPFKPHPPTFRLQIA